MDTAPDWDLYRSFLAIAREGSLSAAARRLTLAQPTLGRHLDRLEASLGVALFARGQRGLVLTEAGQAVLPHARAMEAAAGALWRGVSATSGALSGTLRLSASDIVGCEVLPPLLAGFREAHPGVVLELDTSNRLSDLLAGEADLAVRMTRPTQETLLAVRVGTVSIGLYAHQDYVRRHGLPDTPAALDDHASVGFDRSDHSLSNLRGVTVPLERDRFAFRADNDLAQLAAVRAGLGIGGVQHAIAERDPALVPVLADQVRFELDMWLAMHESLRGVARAKALFDHLAAGLRAYCQIR